jgi:N-acylmannosamine kinase
MPDQAQSLEGYAIDLGGTKIAAARIVKGRVVARETLPTDGAAGPEAQVAAMAELALGVGYRRGAPLGIAVAGRIDREGFWHAVNRGTLSAIDAVPLADMIGRALGTAACVNDAAAAALAEARLGAGLGARNFAFLTVSTGIGGGLVLGGRLLDSQSGLAGHVGFATTPDADQPCGSQRRGTVESVAGGRAMAEAALALGQSADARAICQAARAGQAWAEPIVARGARAIATLIADLTAILGLDAVAIGGSIGLSEGYLARVDAALDGEPSLFRPAVMAASLGGDGPLLGALMQHLDRSGS